MRTGITLLVCLLLGSAPVGADDKPSRPAKPLTFVQAADAVLSANTAKDRTALEALAKQDRPDPWLVADELCHRGEHDVAAAFAKAAPRKAVEHLPAYVASRRGNTASESAYQVLAAQSAATPRPGPAAVLAGLEAVRTDDDSVVLCSLANRMANAHAELRQFEESRAAYLRAGAIAARLGWHLGAALSFFYAGAGAYRRSDWRAALSAWQEALGQFRALGDKRRAAQVQGNIGALHGRLGDPAKAVECYDSALRVKTEVGDKAGAARLLTNLGILHKVLGDYTKALAFHERALAAQEDLGDAPAVARALWNLGDVHAYFEEYEFALSVYDRALEAATAVGNRSLVARVFSHTGNSYLRLGDLAKALTAHERALKESRAASDRDGVAAALGNLGSVYLGLGRPKEALSFHREAMAAMDALGRKPGIATAQSNLGRAFTQLGDLEKALASYERALATREALGDKAGVAATLGALGSVFYSRAEYDKALSMYERALKLKLEVGDRVSAASTRVNIGSAHAALGNPEAALSSYERALETSEALGDKAGAAVASAGIGGLYLQLGDNAKAAAAARAGVEHLRKLSHGLAETEGAAARDRFAELFDVGCRAALRGGQKESLLWFLEQGRANSLREGLGSRSALEAAAIPAELRSLLTRARHAERRALQVYRKSRSRADLAEARSARTAWEVARSETARVSARIQREAEAGASLALSETDGLDRIRGRLQSDEALLLFGLTSAEACALVVRREGARMVALPASTSILAAVDALLDGTDSAISVKALPAVAESLIAPLALGKDVKRVLVSPTGRLGYIPFSLLLPNHEVVYVPSGTTYGLLAEQKHEHGEKILAFGDPDYQTHADEAAFRIRAGNAARLARLPATKREVEAVADVCILAKQATETALQERIDAQPRWRAVHFACHGLVDPDHPMLSALALTADAENDGFLTALEIFRMKIPADLVVLSACETGKGRIYQTEGIVGLTRAFMFAGAPRVICSLWKVDDEATQVLMIKFYELWHPKDGKPGPGAAAALKQAQAYVRDHPKHPEWKHPYYWGAWVLWGLPD